MAVLTSTLALCEIQEVQFIAFGLPDCAELSDTTFNGVLQVQAALGRKAVNV